MVDTKKQASMLDEKIQDLLELICDLKAMEECVLEMKFDTRKAPLGQCDIAERYYRNVNESFSLTCSRSKFVLQVN